MNITTTCRTAATAGGAERIFFKCPVGGYASLRPGICPKCGELLVTVGVSVDDRAENHAANITRTSADGRQGQSLSEKWAGVCEQTVTP